MRTGIKTEDSSVSLRAVTTSLQQLGKNVFEVEEGEAPEPSPLLSAAQEKGQRTGPSDTTSSSRAARGTEWAGVSLGLRLL